MKGLKKSFLSITQYFIPHPLCDFLDCPEKAARVSVYSTESVPGKSKLRPFL